MPIIQIMEMGGYLPYYHGMESMAGQKGTGMQFTDFFDVFFELQLSIHSLGWSGPLSLGCMQTGTIESMSEAHTLSAYVHSPLCSHLSWENVSPQIYWDEHASSSFPSGSQQ